MKPPKAGGPAAAFKIYSVAAGVIAVAIGCLVLIGWLFYLPNLRSTIPGVAPMRTNAAVAFILAGAGLILLQTEPAGQERTLRYHVGQALAVAAGIIGLLTLGEYAFNMNLGIDRLLVRRIPGDFWSVKSPRMPVMAAVNFVLVSLSLLMLDVNIRNRNWWTQLPAAAAGLVGLLGFIGYTYGVKTFYSVGGPTLMALNSAIVFVFFSLGIIAARTDRGVMTLLASDMGAGRIARRLLAGVIAITLVVAPLTLAGEDWGFYGHGFAESLFTLFSVVLLSLVVLLTTLRLQKAEIAQDRNEAAVTQARDELEVRIRERTSDLSQTNERLQTQIAERESAEETVRLLSTPVLRVREQLLILPIVGFLDKRRARQLTDNLLDAIRQNRARIAILDITGTATVDSAVAQHFVEAARAARLLGARVILTGISRENAQTLVRIGVNMRNIDIGGDLQSGIEEGERLLGFELVKSERKAA